MSRPSKASVAAVKARGRAPPSRSTSRRADPAPGRRPARPFAEPRPGVLRSLVAPALLAAAFFALRPLLRRPAAPRGDAGAVDSPCDSRRRRPRSHHDRSQGRRPRGADRSPRPGQPPRSRPPGFRHRLAALGRQRGARLHRRRDRPADFRRGLRRDDPPRHALAVGLAHGAQPAGLLDRPLPLHRVRGERPEGGLRGHPGRPADARDRVAPRQPPPSPSRPCRLPADAPGRPGGDA